MLDTFDIVLKFSQFKGHIDNIFMKTNHFYFYLK